jgi:uncharacterized protein YdhG (YjbR/CyaY superfamily)
MAARKSTPSNIDDYIAACPPRVRPILRKVRATIRRAAPREAEQVISYRIPAFKLHGILVYFAAFENHIGFFPPISGDAKLQDALARYAGPKGNLKFPLKQPIPYTLITRIVKLRVQQNLSKALAKKP